MIKQHTSSDSIRIMCRVLKASPIRKTKGFRRSLYHGTSMDCYLLAGPATLGGPLCSLESLMQKIAEQVTHPV